MDDTSSDDRRFLVWGIAISVALHVLAGVILMDRISAFEPQPQQEAVEVELVPPPEVEEAQPEETIPEAVEVPEEQPPEEQPLEQPPQEEQAQQEEQQQEQAAEEQAAPPPPPPAPPELSGAEEQPSEVPVANPVEQFGEEDTGPQEAQEETPEPPANAEAETETDEAASGETAADSDDAAGEEAGTQGETDADSQTAENETPEDQSAEDQVPDEQAEEETADVQPPETQTAEEEQAAEPGPPPAEEGEPSDEDFGTVGRIVTSALPLPKPPAPARPAAGSGGGGGTPQQAPERADLLPARELFSRTILDDPQARTAMRGMPPGQRLNLLCMTELRAQIASVSAVPPDMLPSFRPPPGNVLEPRNAAFHSMGRWFNVAFRCETDSEVTQVERFSFKIGNEVPRSEWGARGLSGF